MASMLFALRVLNAPGLGTFAVDDRWRLYIDFDAVRQRGTRWCSEALLHECGHLFGAHSERAVLASVRPGEQMTWNVAADAEINDDLRDAGCDTSDAVLPETFDAVDYQTAEHYLSLLRGQQSDQADGDGDAGQASDSGTNQSPKGEPDSGTGDGTTFQGCGSGSGGQPAPCEIGDDDANGEAPAATDAEKERTLIATAASIREASSQRGTVPGGLVERAETLLRPSKVPWQKVLGAAVRRCIATRSGHHDVTYTRRNRRNRSEYILPGRVSPKPEVVVVRDTSGSMSNEELAEVGSEVEAISAKLGIRGASLRVVDVDAEAHEVRPYKDRRTLFDVKGGGGTDMSVGINAALVAKPRPSAIVVATDGYTPWPEEKPSVPVIACIVGPLARDQEAAKNSTPSWMTTVIVDSDA